MCDCGVRRVRIRFVSTQLTRTYGTISDLLEYCLSLNAYCLLVVVQNRMCYLCAQTIGTGLQHTHTHTREMDR